MKLEEIFKEILKAISKGISRVIIKKGIDKGTLKIINYAVSDSIPSFCERVFKEMYLEFLERIGEGIVIEIDKENIQIYSCKNYGRFNTEISQNVYEGNSNSIISRIYKKKIQNYFPNELLQELRSKFPKILP